MSHPPQPHTHPLHLDFEARQRTQDYLLARRQHPAWQLLAARNAPLVLSCLQTLLEQGHAGMAYEEAMQILADLLAFHANDDEVDTSGAEGEDFAGVARRELRNWIKRGLIVEREGCLYATDALETALRFVSNLEGRIMTSTASRLSIVQREIENLATHLDPDPVSRTAYLQEKIQALEAELAAVRNGDIRTLSAAEASEGIRELFNLATGLRADFRRVEDSYRTADRRLRQEIVNERNHRGDIVDKLLNSHDELLQTPEGQVFHGFNLQLQRDIELETMKRQLRAIVSHRQSQQALNTQQKHELRWLVVRLVRESEEVSKARARSERDVKNFLQSGLANEQHRVGELINDILQQALTLDWQCAATRRLPTSLPPVGIQITGLPAVERLRFKSIDADEESSLSLNMHKTEQVLIDAEFWEAFDSLDRQALVHQTIALLTDNGKTMSIAELAAALPPTHDLESIALWLSMAREVEAPFHARHESLEILDRDGQALRFYIPKIELNATLLQNLEGEL